jgi:phosphotransferase system  glucose/maltose/N-acetylglucosamine-specific IIC component
MVTSIRVTLWADTGDIESINEITLAGMPQGESSSATETETPPPSDNSFNNQTQMEKNTGTDRIANVEIIAGVAIVAMVIAVVAVAVKKRKQ